VVIIAFVAFLLSGVDCIQSLAAFTALTSSITVFPSEQYGSLCV
jgi:hypothetical protein